MCIWDVDKKVKNYSIRLYPFSHTMTSPLSSEYRRQQESLYPAVRPVLSETCPTPSLPKSKKGSLPTLLASACLWIKNQVGPYHRSLLPFLQSDPRHIQGASIHNGVRMLHRYSLKVRIFPADYGFVSILKKRSMAFAAEVKSDSVTRKKPSHYGDAGNEPCSKKVLRMV